ncbi:MAG: hypothetical protein HY721_29200 [Planctomycetes bacterium]|nr:hypothetical protein [Planctomycetota bacterium]
MPHEPPGQRTFVGFGFGPIQAGLFVCEALRSGAFRRVVVAEVLPALVASVRADGGRYRLNLAGPDGVEPLVLGPVEVEDPAVPEDRERLVAAVADASEVATAVPSVSFYASAGPGSIHRVLARGLEARGGRPAVVYAAENHNRAAEILQEAVLGEVRPSDRERVRSGTRFLDTVIGKMSAVIADPGEVASAGLATITSGDPRAFLVERFNRILVSRVRFPPGVELRRGLHVFEEKADLLPFEEAKLYGHNAAHALAAYIASLRGLARMEELGKVPGAVDFVRAALLEEAGEALVRKHEGVDPLFTREGFRAHSADLLERMLNPWLRDLVERVARDPPRKLSWDDRLIGTMRLALSQGIAPRRFAFGAAAALVAWRPEARGEGVAPEPFLEEIWRPASPDPSELAEVLRLVRGGLREVRAWLAGGPGPFAHGSIP